MMSSGTAKAQKKEVLFQTVVTVLKSGEINIAGFPSSVKDAMKLSSDFNIAMVSYFVQEASKGNVDKNGFVIKSKIITPSKEVIKQYEKAKVLK